MRIKVIVATVMTLAVALACGAQSGSRSGSTFGVADYLTNLWMLKGLGQKDAKFLIADDMTARVVSGQPDPPELTLAWYLVSAVGDRNTLAEMRNREAAERLAISDEFIKTSRLGPSFSLGTDLLRLSTNEAYVTARSQFTAWWATNSGRVTTDSKDAAILDLSTAVGLVGAVASSLSDSLADAITQVEASAVPIRTSPLRIAAYRDTELALYRSITPIRAAIIANSARDIVPSAKAQLADSRNRIRASMEAALRRQPDLEAQLKPLITLADTATVDLTERKRVVELIHGK